VAFIILVDAIGCTYPRIFHRRNVFSFFHALRTYRNYSVWLTYVTQVTSRLDKMLGYDQRSGWIPKLSFLLLFISIVRWSYRSIVLVFVSPIRTIGIFTERTGTCRVQRFLVANHVCHPFLHFDVLLFSITTLMVMLAFL